MYEIPAVRTIAYLVRMLAISKTGAAFVPIDPDPAAGTSEAAAHRPSPIAALFPVGSIRIQSRTLFTRPGSTGEPKGVCSHPPRDWAC